VVISFVLTRNLPFYMLSPISNLCVFVLFIIGVCFWFKTKDKFIGIVFLILTLLAIYSLFFLHNEPLLVMRFYVILLSLIFIHFIPFNSLKSLDFVLYLNVIQALVIISISCYLTLTWGTLDYLPLRFWFLENGYGDVYTYGNGFFRVQIKGNALIPFFALVSNYLFDMTKIRKYRYVEVILLIATIFAGNFMFLIAVVFYYLFKFFIRTNYFDKIYGVKNIAFMFSLLLMLPILFAYSIDVLTMKTESGKGSSIGVRFDQVDVLLDDVSEDVWVTFTGKGLGNVLNIKTDVRDYSGNTYFEVQAFYFINQLGFVFFIFFVLALFYLYKKYMGTRFLGLLYVSYIIYAVSNPYIFDTNHLIVIISLCLINRYFKSNIYKVD